MTQATQNHSDHLIQEDVRQELAWAPQVTDAHVGVSVLEGVVTLTGEVDTYTEKVQAKKAVLRVKGVSVVADDIVVRSSGTPQHSDTDIGVAIKHVLEWSSNIPHHDVTVEVRNRIVTLSGTVSWNYQREAAERLVHTVTGVLRIDNRIQLTARASATDTAQLIKNALVRHALLDSHAISVTAAGSEVTLTGHVSTWTEKNDAAHAAWSAPHTTAVHNEITIRG